MIESGSLCTRSSDLPAVAPGIRASLARVPQPDAVITFYI